MIFDLFEIKIFVMILKQKFDTSDYSDERIKLYNFKRVNKKSLGFF